VTNDTPLAPTSDALRLKALTSTLDSVMRRDGQRLERRLSGLSRRLKEGKPIGRGLD